MIKLKPIKDENIAPYFVDITDEVCNQFASDLVNIPKDHPWQMAVDNLLMDHILYRIKTTYQPPIVNDNVIQFMHRYYGGQDDNYHIYALTDAGYTLLRKFAKAMYKTVDDLFPNVMFFASRPGAYKGAFITTHNLFTQQSTVDKMRLLYRTLFFGQPQDLKIFNILNHCFVNSNAIRIFENLSIGVNEIIACKEPIGIYDKTNVVNIEITDKKQAIIDLADYVFDTFDYHLNKIDDTPHLKFKAKDTMNNYLRRYATVNKKLPIWANN